MDDYTTDAQLRALTFAQIHTAYMLARHQNMRNDGRVDSDWLEDLFEKTNVWLRWFNVHYGYGTMRNLHSAIAMPPGNATWLDVYIAVRIYLICGLDHTQTWRLTDDSTAISATVDISHLSGNVDNFMVYSPIIHNVTMISTVIPYSDWERNVRHILLLMDIHPIISDLRRDVVLGPRHF